MIRATRTLGLLCVLWVVGCQESLTGPTPEPVSVEPDLVCVEQLTTVVTLRGEGLSPLPVDTLTGMPLLELPDVHLLRRLDVAGAPAAGPDVQVPDEPTDPGSSRVTWTSQQELSFEVFPELSLEPGLYDVLIRNRNDNEGTLAAGLLGVPRPELTRIEPDLLCGEKDNGFTLTGDFFLRLADGSEPTVTISSGGTTRDYAPDEMTGCRALPGDSGAMACTTVHITIGADDLSPGHHDVVLTNPEPASCASTDPQVLTIVPRPTLTEIEPDLACVEDGAVMVTLRGGDFLEVDGETPTLRIGDQEYETSVVDGSCEMLEVMRESVRTCTELTATIGEDDFEPGVYAVTVLNPAPADCESTDDVSWTVVAAPVIESVEPPNVCADGSEDTVLTLTGSGFLFVDGMGPMVTVGDMTYEGEAVEDSCDPIEGVREDVDQCTRMTVTIPAGMYEPGTFDVVVENPPPAGCVSSEPITVTFVLPPTISAVRPTRVCVGGGTLTIDGTGFAEGTTTVTIDGVAASSVDVESSTRLIARFGAGFALGGPYDVVVSNAVGCEDTLEGVVSVIIGPQIFFADPPVLYNGINTQVTLYVTGVTGDVGEVQIVDADGAATVVDHTFDPARPGRLQILVPAGTAPGEYDILLDDDSECEARLTGGLSVTADLTVSVSAVDPPFGWTDSDTAVTVLGEATPPAGMLAFEPVPRLYLNPASPDADTVATPVEAVTFLAGDRLTAIVPRGLPVDLYDLIVVNPDGAVGLLEDAFEVTADAPPTIDTISPGSVENSTGQTFTVLGADFRAADVTLRCLDRDSGAVSDHDPTEAGGTPTSVDATFDASSLANGAVCIVRVTNSDGTYGEFSALTITNPSQNLGMPALGTDLGTPRRAPAAASASATRAARFVYAIGGDDGGLAGALDTVESMPVDIFGAPGAFTEQRYRLRRARTFGGAVRVGRFLYVVGGHDGADDVATVERAYVLDPAERPSVVDLEIQVTMDEGLDPGLYYYRVAAVRPDDHPNNPTGETLASERFPVILPDIGVAGRALRVVLVWSDVPGAAGYRIYRSPAPDDPAGAERLLAEVGAGEVTYTDTGLDPTGDQAPLELGATGVWRRAATLASARRGAAVATIRDPDDPAVWHIYAAGGRGAAGNLDSIEVVSVTVLPGGRQTVADPRTATPALGTARWQAGGYGVDHEIASRVAEGEPWLYVAAGTTAAAGGSAVADCDAFMVQPGGDLGARVVVDRMSPAGAGFGHAAANNFLHVFGGSGGTASAGIRSAEQCGPGRPCTSGGMDPPDPPDLVNWNNAGVNLGVARVHMGTAVLPGFIYIVGGTDGTDPLASSEWVNW